MNILVENVASYEGATLKVTELVSKAILMPMFVYGDCMAVWSISFFLHTCSATGVAEIAESTNFKYTYFCIYSVYLFINILALKVDWA